MLENRTRLIVLTEQIRRQVAADRRPWLRSGSVDVLGPPSPGP
jgi:hypothetical protein